MDCISGLPLCELAKSTNVADSAVSGKMLAAANEILPISECNFLADKAYDTNAIHHLVKDVYGEFLWGVLLISTV